MMLRQRLGIALIIIFLPINGPLWRMLAEIAGFPLNIGEVQFFILSIILFILGGIMTFTPKLKNPFQE
ncbi:MAG: hypothetical protein CXT72_04860 [Methanobacteriota archaeon]|jgi:uncharacterized membrane protein|nr:MAG: hypothetical protein CXT72_04860 [Euryarchaeota archaeon]HIE63358.1 hypothetical protein [Candidatus Poseidoniales archaeon]HIK99606.1 hypothetical protein [Candidatus Poseidoniales archaeon]|tara:strand:+ start:403 stop:606 length:204 start_codon:yes stop_codon:yes gene_type:complete